MKPAERHARTLTTLIVDAHPMARAALALRLAQAKGLSVIGCTDTAAAVAAARRLAPDLVICDTRSRAGDGVALVRALSGLPLHPAVIVYTSFLEGRECQELMEAGAVAAELKDLRLSNLMAAIEAVRAGAGWRRSRGRAADLRPPAVRRLQGVRRD